MGYIPLQTITNPLLKGARCWLNSHHAAVGTSCVAGAVKNTRHITPLKSHHEHCFLQWFIAGANDSLNRRKWLESRKHCTHAVNIHFFLWNHLRKSTKTLRVRAVIIHFCQKCYSQWYVHTPCGIWSCTDVCSLRVTSSHHGSLSTKHGRYSLASWSTLPDRYVE